MSVSKTDQILQAGKSLERGEVVGLGDYTVAGNGSSSSKRAVLAESFVEFHELNSGEKVSAYMHGPTGALIILPNDE